MGDRRQLKVAAIIPARRDSRGLPGKNMRSLEGVPLVGHTISSALNANLIHHVIVSTNDPAVAKYANGRGVVVLVQPESLASDGSPTYPAIRWALAELSHRGYDVDACAVLRATTPLRTAADVDTAVEMLCRCADADSVVSVVEAIGIDAVRLKTVDETGYLHDAYESEGYAPRQRQSLKRVFIRNGAVYVALAGVVTDCGLWGKRCLAYIMPEERSININTQFQFRLAELLLSNARVK
jgi:N-acylneuraminate cytidylyltransferase